MDKKKNTNNTIRIKGARVHNLKNIDIDIPRDQLVVITGLSGSGKSSLAFDTIYAEGQRRYVESLSSYARQFLGLMDKPDVDSIDGLSPAISIDQKSVSHNPRSTVGTVTEIYDYLRLLYARIGIPHCPKCGEVVEKQTIDQINERIEHEFGGQEIVLLAPIIKDKKGEHKKVFEEAQKAGFQSVRLDGAFMGIDEALDMVLDKQKKHNIEIIVDELLVSLIADPSPRPLGDGREHASRLSLELKSRTNAKKTTKADESRLFQSLEVGLDLGDGIVIIVAMQRNADGTLTEAEKDGQSAAYSQLFSCPKCDIDLSELEPRNFSFNSPHGACQTCTGLGIRLVIDPDLVIPNERLTIAEGAIRPWSRHSGSMTWQMRILDQMAHIHGFSVHTPVKELTKKQRDLVLYGSGDKKYQIGYKSDAFSGEYATEWEGIIPNLERRYRETDSDYIRRDIERYMRELPCVVCGGKRLKPEALAVTVAGLSIDQVVRLSVEEACGLFEWLHSNNAKTQKTSVFATPSIKVSGKYSNTSAGMQKHRKHCGELTQRDLKIAKQILKEIKDRLSFLTNVGLSYLTLDRTASSLSGGEAQRIRLATQIGSSLVGVVYILDEPSIGLHQRDNRQLIDTLKKLKTLGNTVLVVEHDEETILAADYVIDIGPGAGANGGQVIAQSTPAALKKNKRSLTGKYLSGELAIDPPKKHRSGNGHVISVVEASEHNLNNITVDIPLGKFVCITGVSGSGKSTLMTDILSRALAAHFYRAKDVPGKHKEITGLEFVDKVITIDQSPIGRTPRSNPATYTGLFTPIRELFTQVSEARIRGYKAGRFSFNVKGGRCEACQGDGLVRIEMHFLPDVYVGCDVCHGKRYNKEALEIHWKGKTIADVLEMDVEEAMLFFESIPTVHTKLKTLFDVGLGYIKLGQSATTLSGGEAQRVKLATELSRRSTGKTLYILDEPTTGLHFEDVKRLLGVLHRLADKGNTVLVIEHNLDVIKSADWIIDLGPEGGTKGGELVAVGTPKDIVKVKKSYTGQYLKKMLHKETRYKKQENKQ